MIAAFSVRQDKVSAFQVSLQHTAPTRSINWSKSKPSYSKSNRDVSQNLFGNLFDGSKSKLILDEPVTVYSNSAGSKVEFEGLGDYLVEWSKMFTNGGIKLTTPVGVETISSDDNVRVRLIFKDTNTGYKNRNEESESGQYRKVTDETKTKKKEDKKKQGGVEILVSNPPGAGLQVTASRCEVDDDTVIKEMSEETILLELQQAIEVWKRETKA